MTGRSVLASRVSSSSTLRTWVNRDLTACATAALSKPAPDPATCVPDDCGTSGASGLRRSRPPAARPTIRTSAHKASSSPNALRKYTQTLLSGATLSKAPSITALQTASNAQPSMVSQVGNIECTIHHAVASSRMPNSRLMPSIHAPALGSNTPEDAPTASSNSPSPQARANSAEPPSTTSPVWEMNSNTPANGAATQGPTISAESIPMTNAPP